MAPQTTTNPVQTISRAWNWFGENLRWVVRKYGDNQPAGTDLKIEDVAGYYSAATLQFVQGISEDARDLFVNCHRGAIDKLGKRNLFVGPAGLACAAGGVIKSIPVIVVGLVRKGQDIYHAVRNPNSQNVGRAVAAIPTGALDLASILGPVKAGFNGMRIFAETVKTAAEIRPFESAESEAHARMNQHRFADHGPSDHCGELVARLLRPSNPVRIPRLLAEIRGLLKGDVSKAGTLSRVSAAVQELFKQGAGSRAIEVLAEVAKTADISTRKLAIMAMARIGKDAGHAIVEASIGNMTEVRLLTARVLGKRRIGSSADETIVNRLREMASGSEPSVLVREVAANSLGQLGLTPPKVTIPLDRTVFLTSDLPLDVIASIREFFDSLSPAEQFVIARRLGIYGYKKCTLENTGKILGVSKDEVRIIETKAIKKLRRLSDR